MKNIIVTDHAIMKRYTRFDYIEKDIEKNEIKQNIINDFKQAKLIRKKHNKASLYSSDNAQYIVKEQGKRRIIITTYPTSDYLDLDDDINFESNQALNSDALEVIVNVLNANDFIIAKNLGYKKIIFVDKYLLLIGLEKIKDVKNYILFKLWELKDLFDIKQLDKLKMTYFLTDKSSEWESFLKNIKMFEYVKNFKKTKYDNLSEEVRTYIKVLNDEIPKFPNRFWQDDIGGEKYVGAAECTKYLIEEILQWDSYTVIKNMNLNVFKNNKLGGMLSVLFSNNWFNALDNAYPEKYKPWLFKEKINLGKYWSVERNGVKYAKEAMEWFLDQAKKDGYYINPKTYLSINWLELFKRYKIDGVITTTFDNNYKLFFKELLGVEYSDLDISRYEYEVTSKNTKNAYVKTLR